MKKNFLPSFRGGRLLPINPWLSLSLVSILCLFTPFLSSAEAPPAPVPPEKPAETPAATAGDQKPGATPADKKAEEPDKKKKDEKAPSLEVVVTADRLPTPREKTGVSIDVVSNEDMQVNEDTHAAEILRMVPGVSISQSGRMGDTSEIRTRGGEVDHTLMLYDGFKVNRGGTGREFNFESLDPVGADRIEIARGPASSLFGTEAVTGTVNLLTRQGEGAPQLTVSGAGGTYGSDREATQVQGRYGQFSYNVADSRFHRQEATVNNSELEIYNYAARFDWQFNCDHALKLIVRGVDFKKGWYEDTGSGFGTAAEPPDPNDTIHNQDWLVGLEYTGHPVPIWETILRLGHYGLDLHNTSIDPNPVSVVFGFPKSPGRQIAQERRASVEWQNNITAYESCDIKDVITAGFYGEHEWFNQDDTSPFFATNVKAMHTNPSGYFQNRLELFDRAFITMGMRHEDNEEFGGFTTARGDVAILIPESDTRVFGSVGNAIRAPSFTELFAPGFGNSSLTPEKNFAYDVGLEQHFWKNRIDLRAVWFHNQFKDLIGFDPAPPFHTINVGTAETRGFELLAAFNFVRQLGLEATATPMSTKDDQGRRLGRRPPRTYTARLVAHPLVGWAPDRWAGLDLSFEMLHVGGRTDTGTENGFNPRSFNPGYTRCDLAASYRFFDHFRAFVRVENIFDEKYQDVLTFPADGSNTMGGLEFSWRF